MVKLILLSFLFVNISFASCDLFMMDHQVDTVEMCDNVINGRKVYISKGCKDCMAKRAYKKSKSFEHVDEDNYSVSHAFTNCNKLFGEVVQGIGSEDPRVMHFCYFEKDGSYVYAPHLVP